MLCEKCKTNMVRIFENSVQGWVCPTCGWEIVTTFIDEIYQDRTEYSIYIKKVTNVDNNKVRLISKIAGVNYIRAKQILLEGNICVLKSTAIEIKKVVDKLQVQNIPFEITPMFNY